MGKMSEMRKKKIQDKLANLAASDPPVFKEKLAQNWSRRRYTALAIEAATRAMRASESGRHHMAFGIVQEAMDELGAEANKFNSIGARTKELVAEVAKEIKADLNTACAAFVARACADGTQERRMHLPLPPKFRC